MSKTAVIGDNILLALVATLLLLSGCSKAGNHAETRKFMAGAKGRFIQVCVLPDYLVEAVIDSKGAVRLYTLTHKDSRVIDVEIQTLKGFAKATGDVDSREISLEPSLRKVTGQVGPRMSLESYPRNCRDVRSS